MSAWIPTSVASTFNTLLASVSTPQNTPLVPSDLSVLSAESEPSSDSSPEFPAPPSIPVSESEKSTPKPPVPVFEFNPPAQDADKEEDDDDPPPFPLLESHQRSSGPSSSKKPSIPLPPPSFTLSAPSAPLRDPLTSTFEDDPKPSKPRSVASSKGSLGTPTTTTKVVKAREKVALAPGHSALDWARVKSSGQYQGKSLKGDITHFPMRVTPSELKKHNKPHDAWTAINGRVYNLTPYNKFHPGGEKELLRCAGRDGTKLFMATHAWVNADFMMDGCMVGMLVPE
ncbi:cytochrome b5 [Phaffia rhodozyma]|uniref:Cytochrome b5 n=1 Tax=Phaffia rhodozyma TaxID=264483 RepID=A0A0F7SHB0_PHARH|nr:cytochrome b5 [Phaffia rhodozyma]